MKKLHNSQIISKLVVITPLTTIVLLMRNFIANFVRRKIPIRSATDISSLLLRGRPRAEGAEQAPVERTAD